MERFYWLFFSIEMVIGFSTFTLLMWWCQWIVSPMLKQPCFPKIKPSRSWYRVIIYFYAWLIPFGEILFRISFPFLLLGFAIKIILAFILQDNLHKELIVPCTYQWCQMGMKVSLYILSTDSISLAITRIFKFSISSRVRVVSYVLKINQFHPKFQINGLKIGLGSFLSIIFLQYLWLSFLSS